MLSDKYIAGFTDADGSISLWKHKKNGNIAMRIEWSQRTDRDLVLKEISSVFGGDVKIKHIGTGDYSILGIWQNKALSAIERLVPYLVIKKEYAKFCIDSYRKQILDLDRYKAERRKLGVIPNYPTRKWLAGYFDGDGCLSINRLNKNGSANMVAHIACSNYDAEGITTIQKNFGGHIYPMSSKKPNVLQWKMHMVPSKAEHFLDYFGKHSVVKKDQIDYILSLARMGNFSNGVGIAAKLKELKTNVHEQRLNELAGCITRCDSPPEKAVNSMITPVLVK